MQRMLTVCSTGLMFLGLMVLTWSFRDLPMAERPEWMNFEMVLWPLVAIGLARLGVRRRYLRGGLKVTFNRFWMLCHGIPAVAVALAPPGWYTAHFGAISWMSLLDFPTAKVMAALWLAVTVWMAWDVVAA